MTRREEREQAFALLFERLLNHEPVNDLVEDASLARDIEVTDFAMQIASGVETHEEEINTVITEHIRGWKLQRLSKTTVALLQLAIYEIQHCGDIPVKVSINEAVELAKIYGGNDDPAYINGVLGSVVKGMGKDA